MKTFIILGMHRSSTSLVAGGLIKMGVDLGKELLPPGLGNPKGHFENLEFLHLNEQIIKEAGGSWNNPPPLEAIMKLKEEYSSKIQEIVKRNQSELWGWKDPRTTLTIPLFVPFLEDPIFIGCFRKPLKIAKSLEKRDRIPIKRGLEIAKIYNKRLLNFLKDFLEVN